jgi:hypothetical protein
MKLEKRGREICWDIDFICIGDLMAEGANLGKRRGEEERPVTFREGAPHFTANQSFRNRKLHLNNIIKYYSRGLKFWYIVPTIVIK